MSVCRWSRIATPSAHARTTFVDVDEVTHRRLADGAGSSPLAVGDLAPDFELRWTFEKSVRLSEYLARGPVLLVFYVFDFGHY